MDIYISGRRIDGKLMVGEAEGKRATWSVRIASIDGVSIGDHLEVEVLIGASRYRGKAVVREAKAGLMLEGVTSLSKED